MVSGRPAASTTRAHDGVLSLVFPSLQRPPVRAVDRRALGNGRRGTRAPSSLARGTLRCGRGLVAVRAGMRPTSVSAGRLAHHDPPVPQPPTRRSEPPAAGEPGATAASASATVDARDSSQALEAVIAHIQSDGAAVRIFVVVQVGEPDHALERQRRFQYAPHSASSRAPVTRVGPPRTGSDRLSGGLVVDQCAD